MSKVSEAMFVNFGLVGPKARPNGVVDGLTVDIQLLGKVMLSLGRDKIRQSERSDEVALVQAARQF
jgi:hypothetical protein